MIVSEGAVTIRNGEITRSPDGIIYGRITEPGTVHTLDDAIEITNAMKKLRTNGKLVMLIDIRNVKFVESKAISYFTSPEHTELVSAQAFLVGRALTRAIARFFLQIHRPPYPAQIFSSESDAVDWLRTFLPHV